ncbi:MAG: hypothetical protein FWD66_06375 [Paludibacter sp.]|nr:hypothetical protein [Paludibacter sp.]
MEDRKTIYLDYSNSGVKTLNGFGIFFLVIGAISTMVTLVGFIMYLVNMDSWSGKDNAMTGISLASLFFPIAISSFAFGTICKGLSTIAKTALYKRAALQEEYDFIEKKV